MIEGSQMTNGSTKEFQRQISFSAGSFGGVLGEHPPNMWAFERLKISQMPCLPVHVHAFSGNIYVARLEYRLKEKE